MRTAIRAVLIGLAAACATAHAERTEVYAGLALLDFDVKGYLDGEPFYRENGLLPGLAVEVAHKLGDWRLSADGRFFSGNTDVEIIPPVTGSGQQTEVDERMYSLSARIARELQLGGWSIAPYAGFGYHHREVEAQAKGVYTWKTVELGAFARAPAWGRFEGGIDVRVFHVLDPEVKADFSFAGLGEQRIALGERTGARLGLVGAYLLQDGLRVRAELYQERWSFGQGEQVVRSGPGFTVSVVEPRSDFRNTGLTLGLVFGF